jgi:hypothetical protein
MGDQRVAFGIEGIADSILSLGESFSEGSVLAAFALVGFCLYMHAVEGAAEIAEGKETRWQKPIFYRRLGMVFVFLCGYQGIFFGLARDAIPDAIKGVNEAWGNVWVNQEAALEELRAGHNQNNEVKRAEVAATRVSKDQDDAWYVKASAWVADLIVTGLGYISVGIMAFLLSTFLLMEGFWALGMATLTLAIGPLCIAAWTHEKSEGAFWAFIRAFFVYVFLYMPLLRLACGFAGIIMAHMTTMRARGELPIGDGSDITAHCLMVLAGPLLAIAIVRSVNGTVTGLAQSIGPGSGSAFAGAMSGVQSAARGAGQVGPQVYDAVKDKITGGSKGKGGGGDGGDKGGGGGEQAKNAAKSLRGDR